MQYYNTIANRYDELHGAEQRRKIQCIATHITVQKSDVIVDIGGGPGYTAKYFPENTVINVDPSQELLHLSTASRNIIGRMERIPLQKRTADWLFCITAIHHTHDIQCTLREFLRVGKHRFVITVLKKAENYDRLCDALQNTFVVDTVIDDWHDTIFVLSRQPM